MSNINNLSLELVEYIVDYVDSVNDLYQCALVSKYFYIASIPKLWYSPAEQSKPQTAKPYKLRRTHNVNLMVLKTLYRRRGPEHYNYFAPSLSEHHFRYLLRGDAVRPSRALRVPLGHCIRKLQFFNFENIKIIVSLVEQAPLVEELSFRAIDVDSATMDYIAQLCPQLRGINLHEPRGDFEQLAVFAQHCQDLRHIGLSAPPRSMLQTLAAFENHPLESLELIYYSGLITLEEMDCIFALQQLTSLKMHNDDKTGPDSYFMQALVPATTPVPLPLLTHVSLAGSSHVGDTFMVSFLNAHPHLESIVSMDSLLGDATLIAIANHLSRLRYLKIGQRSRLSPQLVRHVVHHCRQLSELCISGLPQRWFPETKEQELEPIKRKVLDQIRRADPDWAPLEDDDDQDLLLR